MKNRSLIILSCGKRLLAAGSSTHAARILNGLYPPEKCIFFLGSQLITVHAWKKVSSDILKHAKISELKRLALKSGNNTTNLIVVSREKYARSIGDNVSERSAMILDHVQLTYTEINPTKF
jgi:hypothetical protein